MMARQFKLQATCKPPERKIAQQQQAGQENLIAMQATCKQARHRQELIMHDGKKIAQQNMMARQFELQATWKPPEKKLRSSSKPVKKT